jgi:hypothetical protein
MNKKFVYRVTFLPYNQRIGIVNRFHECYRKYAGGIAVGAG